MLQNLFAGRDESYIIIPRVHASNFFDCFYASSALEYCFFQQKLSLHKLCYDPFASEFGSCFSAGTACALVSLAFASLQSFLSPNAAYAVALLQV